MAMVGVGLPVIGGTSAGAGAPDCEQTPVTMRIEGAGTAAGGDELRITDGFARRVPILTDREEPGQTKQELEKLSREASKTKLAMLQIFLADFKIPRASFTGEFASAFATPDPKAGRTAAVLAIVPTKARGFKVGDTLSFDDELRYETFTTFAPIGLGVYTADGESGSGMPSGGVEVLAFDDESICVSVDFTITDDDIVEAAIEGVVEVPIVRAENKNLYFF